MGGQGNDYLDYAGGVGVQNVANVDYVNMGMLPYLAFWVKTFVRKIFSIGCVWESMDEGTTPPCSELEFEA